MIRREFLVTSALGTAGALAGPIGGAAPYGAGNGSGLLEPTAREWVDGMPTAPMRTERATRKILIAGGGFGTAFIRYMAELTGKPRPRLLYLPTASADRDLGVELVQGLCAAERGAPCAKHVYRQHGAVAGLG